MFAFNLVMLALSLTLTFSRVVVITPSCNTQSCKTWRSLSQILKQGQHSLIIRVILALFLDSYQSLREMFGFVLESTTNNVNIS